MRCRTRRNVGTRQLRSKRLDLAIENCYDAIAQSLEEVLACISWLQRIAARQSCGGGVDGGVNDMRGRCQEILVMTNLIYLILQGRTQQFPSMKIILACRRHAPALVGRVAGLLPPTPMSVGMRGDILSCNLELT